MKKIQIIIIILLLYHTGIAQSLVFEAKSGVGIQSMKINKNESQFLRCNAFEIPLSAMAGFNYKKIQVGFEGYLSVKRGVYDITNGLTVNTLVEQSYRDYFYGGYFKVTSNPEPMRNSCFFGKIGLARSGTNRVSTSQLSKSASPVFHKYNPSMEANMDIGFSIPIIYESMALTIQYNIALSRKTMDYYGVNIEDFRMSHHAIMLGVAYYIE